LGWDVPKYLLQRVKEFIIEIWGTYEEQTVMWCHDPKCHQQSTSCDHEKCCAYPLQTCGNVCGIVAAI